MGGFQGRHFLQIPGPSTVPDRVLRAMDMPVIDHRSAEFAALGKAVLSGSQKIFQTSGPVVIFPSSGTGAWEAAIVNTLSPGDKVLMVETGHFATLWQKMAKRFGLDVEFMPGDWRHGADPAAIGGSQKGLMLPPGLGFNAISKKALAANKTAKLPRAYFEWQPMIDATESGLYPYTPATGHFFGLKEAVAMLEEEGLENVFARHDRLAEATRRAVRQWGFEVLCADPRAYASALTAVLLPEGVNADAVRAVILERFDLSLGAGLGKVAGKVFRIGHLGWVNELMLAGALAGVEMGLAAAGVKHSSGGVQAAMDYLAGNASFHGR
jgi:alanine-glyoxylate transaminase/serine-glyoxylate transaminase/serine-pyruvate transaminase